MKNYLESKRFKIALHVIGGLIVAAIIFQAGMFVGYRKASFSYGFGEKYFERNFGRPRGYFMGMMSRSGDYLGAHGASGDIIKVALPEITIEGRDNVEREVLIKSDTVIKNLRDTIKPEDLKTGDSLVIIGTPNASTSQIEAKLIRVLPEPLMERMMETGR